jgi:hypothetical protein
MISATTMTIIRIKDNMVGLNILGLVESGGYCFGVSSLRLSSMLLIEDWTRMLLVSIFNGFIIDKDLLWLSALSFDKLSFYNSSAPLVGEILS